MLKNSKIHIDNFGPIEKADIDINQLTIFIGANSSGKSYSSLLIHSILSPFSRLNLNNIRQKSVDKFLENNDEVSEEFKESLNEYLSSKPEFCDDPYKFPSEKFRKILEDSFGQILNFAVEEKLKGNFSSDLNKLNRLQKFPFEFSFNQNLFRNENGKLKLIEYHTDFDNMKNCELKINANNVASFEIDEKFLQINLDYSLWHNFFRDESFIGTMFMMIVSSVMDTFDEKSFCFSSIGKESLKFENDSAHGPFYNLACNLERELLHGNIQIKKGEMKDKLIFIDAEYGMEFDVEMTSSSIRQLSFLIIYLKYFLKKGDTLIIEEMENHIHPKNQLILVKYLVEAINQGLNLIITTHSEYIVEKFNNFIRLGNADDEIFEKLDYTKDNILDYGKASIYNFKKVDEYAYIAESIDINKTGFDEDSFMDVNNELYDEAADIIDAEK